MEKLVLKGKKEIRLLLVDSLHQTVQALGVTKSKKKTEKVIGKAAKRIAELIADQMKKELKKIKNSHEANGEKKKRK
jgi:DNA-binding GntR family transcriptional regulator